MSLPSRPPRHHLLPHNRGSTICVSAPRVLSHLDPPSTLISAGTSTIISWNSCNPWPHRPICTILRQVGFYINHPSVFIIPSLLEKSPNMQNICSIRTACTSWTCWSRRPLTTLLRTSMEPPALTVGKHSEEKSHRYHLGTLCTNNNFIRGSFVVPDCMVLARRRRMRRAAEVRWTIMG